MHGADEAQSGSDCTTVRLVKAFKGERPEVYHCWRPCGNLHMNYFSPEELADAQLNALAETVFPSMLDAPWA